MKVIDNFFEVNQFDRLKQLVKQYPTNKVPKDYNGKRSMYKDRNYIVSDNELTNILLEKFPYREGLKRSIEVANDVDGFWLSPHSDHPAKKDVTVIYIEGHIENGTTFDGPIWEETIDFIPNRAINFNPDEKDTWDMSSHKHSVKLKPILGIRRTIVVMYVDETWNSVENCYDTE